ncbi:hypothetical protein AGLY_011888 [Aphis glycines]|uniref:Uracil-DNA glycosylase-like domain-containing protein n=1 Tax=Aphis glycines TaxID=307491 RepID=A0A6G0TBP4_APHGL|nr:hypothetical protein AGLY_011888 [Aphis glycines]
MSVSKYFAQQNEPETDDLVDSFINLENYLVSQLNNLNYGPNVEYIYSPLDYASNLHKAFLTKFLLTKKKVLFLGINPGPWGMCQTGIPFGEVNIVRDYLKVDGEVKTPTNYHPQRPVNGLNCHRSEVSGKRLWDLFIELSKGDPYKFFKDCFIYNYFPLALMNKNAKNITPGDLKSEFQKKLQEICDKSLSDIVTLLQTDTIVAIGKYAEKRSIEVVKKFKLNNIKIIQIPHPSPRSVGTAENWKKETLNQLKSYHILQLFK